MAKKILLADDSITIQKVVELTFSDGDYEVTAVNNGAKAIQKLSETRPDIILSDIIMPEKNGYEVCEFVKSHPEYRNIPVVLLTGTFEPFDPDRAEKAGCDAVVTKPFESQSLIHRVEELISQAQSTATAAPEEPAAAAPSPWEDEVAAPPMPESASESPFAGFAPQTGGDAFTHNNDIFGAAAPAAPPTTEMPFEAPQPEPAASPWDEQPAAFSGETRAFPKMSFEDMQQMASTPAPQPPAAPEPPAASPWDEGPAAFSGETRAFPKMSFDDFQQSAPAAPEPEPEAAPWGQPEPEAESPFGAPPPAEEFSGETRAFPRMSFEELQQMASTPAPQPAAEPESPAAPEASPWDEGPAFAQEEPAFGGGETRAFPKLSFDDLQAQASTPASEPEPPAAASPWDDQPAFSGETRAFPKMSFDEMQQMASAPAPAEPEPAPWGEPEPEISAPSWSPTADTSALESSSAPESFSTEAASPFAESLQSDEATPFAASEPEPMEAPMEASAPAAEIPAAEPLWSPAAAASHEPEPEPQQEAEPVVGSMPPAAVAAAQSFNLDEDAIDKIARRVVQLMSDQVVRNIAWEVIPDLAEIAVKERIRQLENE